MASAVLVVDPSARKTTTIDVAPVFGRDGKVISETQQFYGIAECNEVMYCTPYASAALGVIRF